MVPFSGVATGLLGGGSLTGYIIYKEVETITSHR